MEDRCAIFVGPYGGYLVPTNSNAKPSKNVEEEQTAAVTLPYAAQENLELLTPHLVEGCLDSSFKGGDILGQHPSTGEDVRIPRFFVFRPIHRAYRFVYGFSDASVYLREKTC